MDDKILHEARVRLKKAIDAESENRDKAQDDIRFAAGEQWPESIKDERDSDGRPSLTINRIPQFVRQIINNIRQSRPAIKVSPVDDKSDPDTAKVLTGLIRNIEVTSDAEIAYDTAADFAIRGGFGAIRVTTDYADDDTFDQDIHIERVRNPFTVYFDPNAECPVKSDAKWAFVTELIDEEDAKARYGDDVASLDEFGNGDIWREDDKIRIAEYWKVIEKDEKLLQLSDGTVLTEAELEKKRDILDAMGLYVVNERTVQRRSVKQYIVSGSKVHDVKEWPGKYIPIVFVPGEELVYDGKTEYAGIVRQMRDAQRMYNYWRSAATEKIALEPKAPFMVAEGQIDGYEDDWAEANTRNLPYLMYKNTGAPMPQRQMFSGNAQPLIEQSMMAAEDLKAVTGIYDASLGIRSNETSGRAILARQRQGDTATFHFIDNLSRAIRQVGRILVDLIPKIYDNERVVRILNPDGSNEIKAINGLFPLPGQQDRPDVRVGKYDVVVEVGPSFNTQREESQTIMMELARANPKLIEIAGDLLMKTFDFAYADEIAERLKRTIPQNLLQEEGEISQQPQMPPELLEKQAEMELKKAELEQEAQLELAKLQTEKEIEIYKANLKAQTDLEIARERSIQKQGENIYG